MRDSAHASYRYKEPRQLYATVRDGPDATPDVRVTLSTPDTRAAEGDSTDTATLRLYLSGAGEERGMIAGESLRVPLVFSGGQPGTDFTLSLSGSPVGVTFDPETSTVIFTGPARGTSAAVATLTLTASDDSDANDGTVSVSIPQRSNRGAPRLTASGIPGTATGIRSGDGRILLVDDDAPPPKPVVGIAGGPAVTEGGKASFTVSASPAPSAPLEVALTVAQSGDVAASGATGPRTVTVPVGGSVTVEVATADDSADEPDGSVSVTVEAGAGYTVASSQASTTVAVRDNDATAVSLAAPAGDIAEAGGTKVLTVTLGRALAQGEELSVPLVFGGAAGRGADYRSACANAVGIACANLDSGNAAVTFTGGAQAARTATITLTATADALAEGAGETVTVRLGRLAAKGLGGGAQGTGSVAFRILEPTTPGVSVSTGALSLAESGSAGSYTVALDSAPTTDVTVTATSGDAAKVRVHGPGGTAGASAALVFTPSSWGAQTVTVTPQDDGDASDESVTVSHSVSNTGGYAGVTAPSVTVSVDDDETPVVAFASASSSAGEAAGTRDVAINLDPVPAAGILLAYGVSGTATAGSGHDFIITNYGTVSVPSGAATATIPVTIKDDSIEENSETVVLTLSDGVDYTLGTVKTHTLTITDNDTPLDPEVSVSAAGAVTEGGKASFTVSASPAPSAPLGVALTVAQSGDVAASGETGARTVTVPVGGSVTVEVATADDSADEPDGSVSVTVKAGAGYTVASGQASATVEVRDNDDAPSRPVGASRSAGEIMRQQMVLNAVHDAGEQWAAEAGNAAALRAYTEARAEAQTVSAYRAIGRQAETWVPLLRIVFECLYVGAFPMAVLLMLTPAGGAIFRSYVTGLIWLQSWGPLYAVLHRISMGEAAERMQAAALMPGGDIGISLVAQAGIRAVAADVAVMSGYLSMSVPFLAAALAYGLSKATVLATSVLAVGQDAASSAAHEGTTGNLSLANTGYDTHRFATMEGRQIRTSAHVDTDRYTGYAPGGAGMTVTGDGTVVADAGAATSRIPAATVRLSEALTTRFEQRADHSRSLSRHWSAEVGVARNAAVTDATALMERYSHNVSTGEAYARGVTESDSVQVQALESHYEKMAETAGITKDQMAALTGEAKIGGSWDLVVTLGAEGSAMWRGQTIESDAWNRIKEYDRQHGVTETWAQVADASRRYSTSTGDSELASLDESLSANLTRMRSSQERASLARQEAESWSEMSSQAGSDVQAVERDLSQPFFAWLQERPGMDGRPLGAAGALRLVEPKTVEDAEQLREYADAFVAEKFPAPAGPDPATVGGEAEYAAATEELRDAYGRETAAAYGGWSAGVRDRADSAGAPRPGEAELRAMEERVETRTDLAMKGAAREARQTVTGDEARSVGAGIAVQTGKPFARHVTESLPVAGDWLAGKLFGSAKNAVPDAAPGAARPRRDEGGWEDSSP